jgi:hypothetical protein
LLLAAAIVAGDSLQNSLLAGSLPAVISVNGFETIHRSSVCSASAPRKN